MLLNLGLNMTLVCYLYSNVSIDYVHFEVEVCARMAYYVCCELRNCRVRRSHEPPAVDR